MHPELARRLGNIAVAVSEHALEVLPLDPLERRQVPLAARGRRSRAALSGAARPRGGPTACARSRRGSARPARRSCGRGASPPRSPRGRGRPARRGPRGSRAVDRARGRCRPSAPSAWMRDDSSARRRSARRRRGLSGRVRASGVNARGAARGTHHASNATEDGGASMRGGRDAGRPLTSRVSALTRPRVDFSGSAPFHTAGRSERGKPFGSTSAMRVIRTLRSRDPARERSRQSSKREREQMSVLVKRPGRRDLSQPDDEQACMRPDSRWPFGN
ncbi:uncharacterized protein SOCEGT47_072540 [Sorangium cellulosum]|uniref:Uncharacterized protein n=1 Tax=Sorangium cellulosum TaxID=56 RepID=A0A4P2QAJ3_SORCE|nr:uncharacterized protein SOCEGT47_072540 [Sorangium cellulosum]